MTNPAIIIRNRPTMPDDAITYLEGRLAHTRCFLEYGAGGSTVLAATLGVGDIYSVESDPGYVAAVEAKVATVASETRLHAHYADIGPTGVFGHPMNRTASDRWPAYSAAIWDRLAADAMSPDLILVDGRFRVACCLISFLNMAPEATVMFDDYFGREEKYEAVTQFAPIHDSVGRVAIFRKPEDADREAMSAAYRRFAKIPL